MFDAASAPPSSRRDSTVALPSPTPSSACHPPAQARLLLDLLSRAAETGAPCPSNFALMDVLDLASPDSIRKSLASLRAGGFIALESSGQRRRVTILATGARTGWSQAGGRARAGAAYSDGWGNGSDAILARLAQEGLDLATMATRLGRTPSSVRHRLRRLRAAGQVGPAKPDGGEAAPSRQAAPATCSDPGPLRRDIVTTDPNRPAEERAQIAAFLAAGKGCKLPTAYAGEVRGGAPLTGLAPISPLARRVLLVLDHTPASAATLAYRARLDPLLLPEILRDLGDAGLAVRHRTRRRAGCERCEARFTRGPSADETIVALGLETARAARAKGGGR